MRKIEKSSFGWPEARVEFETSDISIRKLAAKLDVDEKTVRLKVKADGWERNSAPIPQPETLGEAVSAVIERLTEPPAPIEPSRLPSEIARDTCGTLDVARAELDVVIRNLHILQDIADADIDSGDEKAAQVRRRLIDKVLSLPSLVKSLNDLTSAIARLEDMGPGKKQERQERAERSSSAGKFAAPAAPAVRLTH